MKKHIFIILVIVVISISINVLLISRASNTQDNHNITTTDTVKFYILKDYNGRIALFESGSTKPKCVYDIFTSSLPEEDAKNIRKGIKTTLDEIEKTVYEYTS